MPIPGGEIRRLREEEQRRQAAHRRIRQERLRKRLFWLLIGGLLAASLLLISHFIPSYAATQTNHLRSSLASPDIWVRETGGLSR